jgi:hypothetical protein
MPPPRASRSSQSSPATAEQPKATPRSALNRLAGVLAAFIGGLPVAVALSWIAARAVGERSVATQPMAWIPVEALFAACVLLVAMGWMLRVTLSTGPTRLNLLFKLGLLATTLSGFGVVFGAWNLHRMFSPVRTTDDSALDLIYLNLSAKPMPSWGAMSAQADILVIANAQWREDLQPAWSWIGGDEQERDALTTGRCTVMTRHRIVRYATVSLEFDELWPAGVEPQRGWVCAVELITRQGQPVCLWVVDMPSSPLLPRRKAMRFAMEQIRSWTGAATVMDQQGIRTTEPMAGLPLPDLVVGDFNTPRWSASLDAFSSKRVLDLTEVSAAVGHGPSGTFPSPWSVLPIDLVFTGPQWRGLDHQTQVLPRVRHRAVSVTVAPVGPVGQVQTERVR